MKKTLIWNGSPRKNGDTAAMIQEISRCLQGEIRIVEAYRADIRPCVDCRWCFEHEGCAIRDEMQEIYEYIRECDHVILAAPIYFGEISGQLLAVLSRLQTFFSAKYLRKDDPVKKKKTGAILLTAGSFGPVEKAEDTAKFLLREMGTESIGTVYAGHTDKQAVGKQPEILEQLHQLGERLDRA